MAKFATLWFWEKGPLIGEWMEVFSYSTEEHPKPSVIRSNECPTTAEPFTSTYVDNGRLRLYINHDHLPDAPPMWYVYATHAKNHLPSQTLIGFDTDHFSEGTVVTVDEVRETGVKPIDRVAAINWGLYDPVLYQLYVADTHRRRRIGTKLIHACDIVQVAQGSDKFIYGGEQVTELGKQYGEAWVGSTRRRDPQIIMPPMD